MRAGDLGVLDGLERELGRVGEEDRAIAGEVVVELMASDDLRVRTLAVGALRFVPVDVKAVVELMGREPGLFRRDGFGTMGNLERAVLEALAGSPDAAPACREALDRHPVLAVFMAESDGAWLVANAERIERRVVGGVVRKLPTHELRAGFITAKAPWDADVAKAWWWTTVPRAEELKALL